MSPLEISSRYDSSILIRRWIACWIDYLLFFGLFLLAMAFHSEETQRTIFAASLVPVALYFPVLEGRYGTTLGKRIAGIVVVDEFGLKPGFYRAIIRTLLRLIEVNPLLAGGAPAGLVAMFTKTHQRVGDMIARTFVIKTQDLPLLLQ